MLVFKYKSAQVPQLGWINTHTDLRPGILYYFDLYDFCNVGITERQKSPFVGPIRIGRDGAGYEVRCEGAWFKYSGKYPSCYNRIHVTHTEVDNDDL